MAFPSELLFFEAAFLVLGTAALYHSLETTGKATTLAGCGLLAIAISVMALVAIVHGRLAYPVYGIRVRTPDVAAFIVALYYGGLHAISLLLGLALVFLGLAMKRGVYWKRIAYLGFVTGPVAILGGYPYAIGPMGTLLCQAIVAAWFVAVGATLSRLGGNGPEGPIQAARACSRQAGLARGAARAAGFVSAVKNVGLCGRGPEGPQLMRQSLGGPHQHMCRGEKQEIGSQCPTGPFPR